MVSAKHPVQPLVMVNGVLRCKENAIVRFLLDAGPYDLNQLSYMPFSQEDREQFAQLIGYSLCGLGEIPYISDETYYRVASQNDSLLTRIKDRVRYAWEWLIGVGVDEDA